MDVAYVGVVAHVCYKRLLPMFHLFFQTYVASVLCFAHMLQSVLFGCYVCFQLFFQVFQTYVASVSAVSDESYMCFI